MKASAVGGICLCVLMTTVCAAGPATRPADAPGKYGAEAREVMAHFQKTFFDPKTGLYDRSVTDRRYDWVWREAAAFSALAGAARHEPRIYTPLMNRFFQSLNVYWDSKAPIHAYEPGPTRGNGHDKYYDDNAWMVITFVEAYAMTGRPAYLTRAQETAQFVASGWDDRLGGGIWWHSLHKDDSKNVCSNAPAAVGYLLLARFEPPRQARVWIADAKKTVQWTCDKLQDTDGLFDDHIIVSTGEVKRGKLTYNSALMIRAFADLYRQSGQEAYLKEAQRIARAADWFADAKTGVWRDPLKWSHFMVEADIDLYRATGQAYLLRRAKANADAYYAAWKKSPPDDMMSNADLARILWLLADTETPEGRAFWSAFDQGHMPAAPVGNQR